MLNAARLYSLLETCCIAVTAAHVANAWAAKIWAAAPDIA